MPQRTVTWARRSPSASTGPSRWSTSSWTTTGRGARTGGIVTQEAPVHVSNVAMVDPETKTPTRIRTRLETVERDGRQKVTRIRVAVRSGKDLS